MADNNSESHTNFDEHLDPSETPGPLIQDSIITTPPHTQQPAETTSGPRRHSPEELEARREWMATHRPPLFIEPATSHSPEEKVAAMRAAIEAGADVNQLDLRPYGGHNEGRPLHACLLRGSIADNLPAIELLLRHGADPRLHGRSVGQGTPMSMARYWQQHPHRPEHQPVWDRVLVLFEEAVVRLGPEKRRQYFDVGGQPDDGDPDF